MMWFGVVIVMVMGTFQPAVELFETKADCLKAVEALKKEVQSKNHPEITFAFGKCEQVK
jgi:hypothetical protein